MVWLMSLNADVFLQARGDKRLSLIQMVLLTHLKAEFEKKLAPGDMGAAVAESLKAPLVQR